MIDSIPLAVRNLSVQIGSNAILNQINLELKPGTVTGLVGRNGSGKTTLVEAALGFLPSTGSSALFGQPIDTAKPDTRTQLGYAPQSFIGFDQFCVGETLQIVGKFYPSWDTPWVESLLETWGLDANAKVAQLSEGHRQLLCLLLAMGHHPKLLILDEPMAALDPVVRRQVLQSLVEMNVDHQQTVLLSSHIISDLERVASDIAILHGGCLLHCGEIDQLRDTARVLHLRGTNLPVHVNDAPLLAYHAHSTEAQAWTIGWSEQQIHAFATSLNATVIARTPSLEDLLIGVTQ